MTAALGADDDAAAISPLRMLWPFGLGMLALGALWLGPLPTWATTAFSPHMLLHLGLVTVVAPLLAIGLVRAGYRIDARWALGLALAASLFDLVVVWSWHAPPLHALAATRPPFFALQQLSFLAAGLAVWLTALGGAGRAGRAAGLLGLSMSFMHMSMLGVLLTLAPTLLYDPALCRGAFGFDSLADQRLGGILMALIGGLVHLTGAAILAHQFLSGDLSERPARSLERRAGRGTTPCI